MRILKDWQYQYIEKCLFNYRLLVNSELDTEKKMISSINEALEYFKGTSHETMIREFYFKRYQYVNRYATVTSFHSYICEQKLCTEKPNGYVIRREIVYRIAMNCFQLGLFKNSIDKS